MREGGERMRRTSALGRYGEEVATRYLEGLGLVIVERNWRGFFRHVPRLHCRVLLCRRGECMHHLRRGDLL